MCSSFVGQLGDKKSLNRQSKLSFSTKQPNGPSSAGSNEVSEVKVKTELRNSSQNQDESLPDVSCSRVKEEERRPLVDVKTEVPSSQSATYAMAGRCTLNNWPILGSNANEYVGYRWS